MNKLLQKNINKINKVFKTLPSGALVELIKLIKVELDRRGYKYEEN